MACHVSIAAKGLNDVRFSIVVHHNGLGDIALSGDAVVRGLDYFLVTVWNQLCVRGEVTCLAPMSSR